MSPVSLVFHTIVTVKMISKMLFRTDTSILISNHLKIKAFGVVQDWYMSVFQTEVQEPYPQSNGGQV